MRMREDIPNLPPNPFPVQALSYSLPILSPTNVLSIMFFFFFPFLFFKIFLMWTIFKVFIDFVTILPLFYVLFFWPRGIWDLSSLTRDQTRTPSTARRSPNHWTAKEVPSLCFSNLYSFPLLISFPWFFCFHLPT